MSIQPPPSREISSNTIFNSLLFPSANTGGLAGTRGPTGAEGPTGSTVQGISVTDEISPYTQQGVWVNGDMYVGPTGYYGATQPQITLTNSNQTTQFTIDNTGYTQITDNYTASIFSSDFSLTNPTWDYTGSTAQTFTVSMDILYLLVSPSSAQTTFYLWDGVHSPILASDADSSGVISVSVETTIYTGTYALYARSTVVSSVIKPISATIKFIPITQGDLYVSGVLYLDGIGITGGGYGTTGPQGATGGGTTGPSGPTGAFGGPDGPTGPTGAASAGGSFGSYVVPITTTQTFGGSNEPITIWTTNLQSGFSSDGTNITCSASGYYAMFFTGQIKFENASELASIAFYKNGSALSNGFIEYTSQSDSYIPVSISYIADLSTSDTIAVYVGYPYKTMTFNCQLTITPI
jgi:hypothetical protein